MPKTPIRNLLKFPESDSAETVEWLRQPQRGGGRKDAAGGMLSTNWIGRGPTISLT